MTTSSEYLKRVKVKEQHIVENTLEPLLIDLTYLLQTNRSLFDMAMCKMYRLLKNARTLFMTSIALSYDLQSFANTSASR